MRVLVIEDDERLADVLVRGLADAGHEVSLRANGGSGLKEAATGSYDAIVLDWMLPGLNGPTVCRLLREGGDGTPVLMLTAKHDVTDRVSGLDAGADDYLTKPFAFDELLARLRVFSRRGGHRPVLQVDDLVVDCDRRRVMRGEVEIPLTAREFDLLALLVSRAGRVVTRQQIFDEIWDGESDLRSNAIDVHVANVRAKVDRPFGRSTIQTIRGIGFQLL